MLTQPLSEQYADLLLLTAVIKRQIGNISAAQHTVAVQAGNYQHNSITVGPLWQTRVQFLGGTLSSSARPCLSSFLHPAATLQEIRWPPNFSLAFIACCTDWMADKNKGTQNPLMMRGSAIFLRLLWLGITTKTAAVARMSTNMFCRNKMTKHKTLEVFW